MYVNNNFENILFILFINVYFDSILQYLCYGCLLVYNLKIFVNFINYIFIKIYI